MKHIFIVETADHDLMSPKAIDILTDQITNLVERRLEVEAYTIAICNQKSAIRAMYRLYRADESESPNELGSAK